MNRSDDYYYTDSNGNQKERTNDSFSPYELVVAKNGSPIVFSASHDGEEWLASLDSSGAGLRWLTNHYEEDLSISDDGDTIVFQLDSDNNRHLALMSAYGGSFIDMDQSTGYTLLTNGAGISPDGDTVVSVYADSRQLAAGLILISAGTGQTVSTIDLSDRLFIESYPPQFTLDGRYIIFCGFEPQGTTGQFDLYMIKTDGSDLRNLTQSTDITERYFLVR